MHSMRCSHFLSILTASGPNGSLPRDRTSTDFGGLFRLVGLARYLLLRIWFKALRFRFTKAAFQANLDFDSVWECVQSLQSCT